MFFLLQLKQYEVNIYSHAESIIIAVDLCSVEAAEFFVQKFGFQKQQKMLIACLFRDVSV